MLLVDDSVPFCRAFGRALAARGLRAVLAANLAETKKCLAEEPELALAVVDLNLDGASGLEVIAELRALRPTLPSVVLSGYFSVPGVLTDAALGVVDYVPKSSDLDWLARALAHNKRTEIHDASSVVKSVDRVEWEHIHSVLDACEGNKSEAARRLGMHRSVLQRKLARSRPRH